MNKLVLFVFALFVCLTAAAASRAAVGSRTMLVAAKQESSKNPLESLIDTVQDLPLVGKAALAWAVYTWYKNRD